jgi:hypothetical protein
MGFGLHLCKALQAVRRHFCASGMLNLVEVCGAYLSYLAPPWLV